MRGSGLVLSDNDAGLAVGHGADRGGRAEDTWECRGASGVRKTFLAEAQRTQRTTKKQQSIFLRFSLCTLRLCEKSFLLLVFAFRQWLLVFWLFPRQLGLNVFCCRHLTHSFPRQLTNFLTEIETRLLLHDIKACATRVAN